MPYREGRWRNVHDPHHRIVHEGYSHTCQCGKLAYRSKTEAKRAMREAQDRYSGQPGHWNTYRCGTDPDAFHYGHLPKSVVKGHISRGEVYGDE
jgi:hypothetical protein